MARGHKWLVCKHMVLKYNLNELIKQVWAIIGFGWDKQLSKRDKVLKKKVMIVMNEAQCDMT